MALSDIVQRFSAARKFVETDGTLTREIQAILQQLIDSLNTNVDETNTGITDAEGSAATAQAAADVKVYTFTQITAPVDGDHPLGVLETGDIWHDSDDGNHPYRYSGVAWVSQRDGTIATAQTTANTGVTNAATAQTDLEQNNVTVEDLAQFLSSSSTPTWPADFTTDHVLAFKRQGSTIATHTVRVFWDQSAVTWTVTSQAETGEATVETITGSGGKDAKCVVSHTGSGIIGKVTAQATDISGASTSPSK